MENVGQFVRVVQTRVVRHDGIGEKRIEALAVASPCQNASNVGMMVIALNFHVGVESTFLSDVLLESVCFFALVVEQAQHFAPFAHAKRICKLRGQQGHAMAVLLVGLDDPAMGFGGFV